MRALPCVLALALLPSVWAAEDTNWLANPGFETGANNQPANWGLGMEGKGEGEAVWQEGGAHSGQRCLRVKLTTEGDYFMGRQYLDQPVEAGKLYQINGWYRSDTEGAAHPVVYNKKATGEVFAAWETSLPLAPEWTFFQFALRAPAGTERFEVQLRNQSFPGTSWFDDVFLGSGAALEAALKAQADKMRQALTVGPLALRALRPSERPQMDQFADPKRWDELQAAQDVSIFAAREERESFGAVVMGLGANKLTATLSTLRGPGGATIKPAEATIRWADWVQARGTWTPDPLWEKQPFTAPATGAPILWVSIHVPTRAPAGVYTGEVIAQAGKQTAKLPVRLQVYDFALPKTTALSSSFWIFRHTIRNAYGMKEIPFSFYTKWLDLCLQSRLAPIDAAEWHDQPLVTMVRRADGQLDVDWPVWDQYLRYCMDRGMSTFNVADDHWFGSFLDSFPVRDLKTGKVETVKLDRASKEWEQTVIRFFRLAREHFTQKGWADRAYLQGYDEPGNDAKLQAEIKRFYDLARTGWPGLGTLITTPINFGTLGDSIGIWCPLTPSYDDKLAAEARAKGQRVWWYVCCGPGAPWANFFLRQPGASHRVLFWQTFGRKSEGLLYWGVNHWPDFCAREMAPLPADKKWPAVPWNDDNRDGDGYFLYPGPDGPLTSMRFEIMRDGVDDYDALRMLQDLRKQKAGRLPATLKRRIDRALTMTPDIYKTMTTYPFDAKPMVERRREVNELIVSATKCR